MRAPAAALAILVSLATADLLPDSDGLCQRTTDTLCVKDAFLTIAIIARSVNRTATEIDRHIVSKYKEIYTLAWSLNYEMGIVQRHLPPPAQHVKFAQRSNVDRKYLTDVLLEAHNALLYYYKSIESILNMHDAFSKRVDDWLTQMAHNMRYEMICRYRSVLSVYGMVWSHADEIEQVPFSRHKYKRPPSIKHDVQSMVVVRVVREWMSKMHEVLTNMERKYHSTLVNL